ncbi:MAG: single-stranded DNA-binding protein [Selenomonadaceae bacterium]|nr:single-stranded DNA-binding protein [Selenomonadaceae bacterium]
MNKVFLSGYLIRDPEVRYTPTGKAVAKTAISVNRRTKNAETGYYDSDIFNLTAWEKTAEFCGRYLTKGSKVLVEGSLRTSNYETKDGTKRYMTEVWIVNIEFADSKRNGNNVGGRSDYKNNSQDNANEVEDEFSGESVSDDDMPF